MGATGRDLLRLVLKEAFALISAGVLLGVAAGLALARLQVGLAIVMLNVLKWHKIKHARLEPLTLKPAA